MILRGVDPSHLTAQQMCNVAYALLVRDQGSPIDRAALDRALSGELPLSSGPALDEWSPTPPPWGNREPTKEELDALRDSWGADPSAVAGQSELKQFLSNLPPS